MNKWQELALKEKHFPQLPPSPDHAKMAEVAQREADAFAAIQTDPRTITQIAKITGQPTQMVRFALIGLTACKRVATKKGERGELLYCLPEAVAPAPVVEKYPNTVITERRSGNEMNGINNRALIAVRLPAPPWHGRKSDVLAATTAQTQGDAVAGRVGGVL